MELISTNGKNSFNPTPRLKSSPVPILFIPFNSSEDKCNYCKNEYSWTKPKRIIVHIVKDYSGGIFSSNLSKQQFLSKKLEKQKYCKNCLFDYVNNLTGNNIYLDVIYTKKAQCIEHKDSGTQNIQEWCNSCSEISHFNQIFPNNIFDYYADYEYKGINCNLCKYTKSYDGLCPNCYFISSEWIESTLVKSPIPIVYLPWWDCSSRCMACEKDLKYKYDCQKWCSYCYIIYTWCRYCLTTNIIFGITEQSKCRKCKRVIDIDVTGAEYNLENFLSFTRIYINNDIVNNYMSNKQYSDFAHSFYKFMQMKFKHPRHNSDNNFNPIGQIRFISFSNNLNECDYCGVSYSSTLLFEQKYCKYCLYWELKNLSNKDIYLDEHITNSNTHCTEHESKNIESYTRNIREWCMNCSEILDFKQTITKCSFDMNYYYEIQNELSKYEKEHKLQQISLNDTEFGWIESILTEETIPILYLSRWYSNDQCIICKHILNNIYDCQKWCSNCFTIYTGCRYCLTTNIVFGLTNQSKCKKCERISFITIDTKSIMENFIVSTKINANNHDQIVNYVNDKNPNLLKLYGFISKLNYFDRKYISYSNLENNENFSMPIIFVPFNNDYSSRCCHCGNSYSLTLLFKQSYCKYCFYWYIKFTKFTTQNMVDVYIITNSNIKCTEHEPRNLDFCTQNICEWCMNCSEISYFKQIITQDSFDIKERSKVIKSENCNLCGNLINQQISFMCLDCYSVSSGYIELILIKKKIPILYLPWWDMSDNCIACKQRFEYNKFNYQKWCLHCVIFYNRCRYCLTTNMFFGFTIKSQCIKCKRVEPIDHNILDEILNSIIDTTNDEIAYYMNNTDKDNDPLKIYEFIKNKLNKVEISYKDLKMIEFSKTEDFKRIAEGGFGIIYKAAWKINVSDKKIVAVKKFLKSQNIGKYFINELKSFIQYHNRFEHIIKYYGITQDPNTKDHMIIMQYADGGDLHNYLQKYFKNITWNDKLTIILEISRGVYCIHEENFIHRDLHSGNILSVKRKNSNNKWHIGDLGLSRPANITSSNNEIYGVIPYISPEVFNGKAFSKESDIYSMGMIMWELTSGCKPFADFEHNTELIFKIIDGNRPEITNDTPECFANLMKKCWDSDSSKRPHIKEIRKTISIWAHKMNDNDQFHEAETTRIKLIEERKLGPEYAVKTHPGAIYTSRLLNSLTSSSSISSSSSTSFNTKQELEFDINDAKCSSSSELNSATQNLVNHNAIYTSRPLNELFPTKQEYSSREIEFDINDARWSPLPDVNPIAQNSLHKIVEIKTEIQNNEKLVKINDDINL